MAQSKRRKADEQAQQGCDSSLAVEPQSAHQRGTQQQPTGSKQRADGNAAGAAVVAAAQGGAPSPVRAPPPQQHGKPQTVRVEMVILPSPARGPMRGKRLVAASPAAASGPGARRPQLGVAAAAAALERAVAPPRQTEPPATAAPPAAAATSDAAPAAPGPAAAPRSTAAAPSASQLQHQAASTAAASASDVGCPAPQAAGAAAAPAGAPAAEPAAGPASAQPPAAAAQANGAAPQGRQHSSSSGGGGGGKKRKKRKTLTAKSKKAAVLGVLAEVELHRAAEAASAAAAAGAAAAVAAGAAAAADAAAAAPPEQQGQAHQPQVHQQQPAQQVQQQQAQQQQQQVDPAATANLGKAWQKADISKLARLAEDRTFLLQAIPEHPAEGDLDWELISRHFGRYSRGGAAVRQQYYNVVRLMKEARHEGKRGTSYVDLVQRALSSLPDRSGTVYEIQAVLKRDCASCLDKYQTRKGVRWKLAVSEVLRDQPALFEAVGKTASQKIVWRLREATAVL